MSDDIESDADSWWVDRVDVYLVDGPLAGTTVIAPARTTPPQHIMVLPGEPMRVRAGPNPPADLTGWELYGSKGFSRAGVHEFTYRRPAHEPAPRYRHPGEQPRPDEA